MKTCTEDIGETLAKRIDPDAMCFFDLPRELRNMIYEFYFINYRRDVRRAQIDNRPFRERQDGSDEDDGEVDSDENDGDDDDHASQ